MLMGNLADSKCLGRNEVLLAMHRSHLKSLQYTISRGTNDEQFSKC